jgi:hypothetical protein
MKLSTYENPISGKSSNLFDVGNIWSQILGVFVFILIFIFGQKLADNMFPNYTTEPTEKNPNPAKKNMRFF